MIKFIKKAVKDKKSQITIHPKGTKGVFIYCNDPTDKEIIKLSKTTGLDTSLIKDALDPYEVPRLEEEKNYIFVISSFPIKDNDRLMGIPFAVAIGDTFVALISSKPMHFLEDWFMNGDSFITTQKTKLVNRIFRKLMEEYNSQLNKINREVHKISLTPGNIESTDITRLIWYEESLNLIVGDLVPTDTILKNILSGKKLKLFDEDRELIEDTILYTEQIIDMVKQNQLKISNMRNVYSVILTDNLNNTMKFLAAITVFLTVPTIIASIYGMNVHLPLENHPLAFVFIILIILLFSILLIYFFIKNKWF